MRSSATHTEKLDAMGFRKCGEWHLEEDKLKCILTENATAQKVLYAFISENTVLYIGKTVLSLKKRMYGYQKPGKSQSTNIKGNKLIKEVLVSGSIVEIHALPDNGLLYYGCFHVNLAAGLEDSIIQKLAPKWNKFRI